MINNVQTEEDRIRESERSRLRALVAADITAAAPLHADDFQLITRCHRRRPDQIPRMGAKRYCRPSLWLGRRHTLPRSPGSNLQRTSRAGRRLLAHRHL